MRRLRLALALALALPAARGGGLDAADRDIADRATVGNITVIGIPHVFADNRIDWLFNPTREKGPLDHEWLWQLNRMDFWPAMARAYVATKDEKYARAFARQAESWLDQTGGVPPESDFNGPDSPWRTIEQGIRLMTTWPTAWEAFRPSPSRPTAAICGCKARGNGIWS